VAEGTTTTEVASTEAPIGSTPPAEHHPDRERLVAILEASLLAFVALLAAWSGYAAAKWSTESRLILAKASTARTQASQAATQAGETTNFDASTFEAWFSAYVAGNEEAMAIAARRFRPEFRVAFDAWQATSPATNPAAPPGPTYMPEYHVADRDRAAVLDALATAHYNEGADAAQHADIYVLSALILATVLFLVGISRHFPLLQVRLGLIGVGAIILVVAGVLLVIAPKPPL
jgi:hypothetical protein